MIEKLEKYRSAVMGVAIVWIMAYHSNMSVSSDFLLFKIIRNIRSNGFGGVDIFLFVSGFGLYYSLSGNSDQLAFYKRRLARILPPYLPVLALWLITTLPGFPRISWIRIILGNITGSSFWIGPSPTFNWYMAALYVFYFFAPFFFQVIEHHKNARWVLAGTFLLDVCFYGQYVMIAVSRFTIFVMGMELGRWSKEKKQINLTMEIITYILGIFSYGLLFFFTHSLSGNLLWNGGFYWYPFIMITPALTFLLCRFFSWIDNTYASFVLRIFETAGVCSLEINLIQTVAFGYINLTSNIMWLFVYGVMILCGYIYHVVITKLRGGI